MENSIRGTYSLWKEGSRVSLNDDKQPEESNKKQYSFYVGTNEMLFKGPLNILLICVPIGIICYLSDVNEAVTFVFALLAIAPLAERLGFCTEQLAIHTNDAIGGLLNATFGNATELIVALTALSKGLYRLVQLSLLGSILSNLLLVLGTSLFLGGLRFKTQTFGKISAQVNAGMLVIATMSLVFPTVMTLTGEENSDDGLNFSRAVSVFLFITYAIYIYFQLFTHRDLFEEDEERDGESKSRESKIVLSTNPLIQKDTIIDSLLANNASEESSQLAITVDPNRVDSLVTPIVDKSNDSEKKVGDVDDDEDILGVRNAMIWMAIVTFLIAILSDALSATIEDAGDNLKISGVFLSTIVLPIVGNAAEHASAVIFAMKDKLDISLGVAVGSSTQIALFVIPLLVIVGWFGNQSMSLDFGSFEAASLLLTVILVTFVLKDGTSNYMVGLVLVVAYLLVAAGFLVHFDEDLSNTS